MASGSLMAGPCSAGAALTNHRYALISRTHNAKRSMTCRGHNNNQVLRAEDIENNINDLCVTEPKLRELFDKYDVNKNGYLEFEEVKRLYNTFDNFGVEYSDREIREQIKKYAIRDDGKVDYDEFCAIVLSIAQR
eukprot:TRINITY_DN47725_c0_g1_i1.p1 TRINITY_DN47725_c0_g1~~TRINITY_DN47725_c0_g1_i1.p1  ORF type:complete len:154 (+),score=37.85 TRINITY_DN47725_c0_g1_i1:59-463(+)